MGAIVFLLLFFFETVVSTPACLSGCTCSTTQYNCYYFHHASVEENMFEGYPELSQIILIGSSLTTLPSGIFAGLSHLQELKLPNNQFSTLPAGIFKGLSSLSRLTLSFNKLISLPDGLFRDSPGLSTLRLDNNRLTSFPSDMFSGTVYLEFLDASDNEISELRAHVFSGLSKLQSVSLVRNKLAALVPDVLKGLHSLQSLDLADNEISVLAENSFVDTPKLYSLYLYRNHICSYGAAVSPESIAQAITGEVGHRVDIINTPQRAQCMLEHSSQIVLIDSTSDSGTALRGGMQQETLVEEDANAFLESPKLPSGAVLSYETATLLWWISLPVPIVCIVIAYNVYRMLFPQIHKEMD